METVAYPALANGVEEGLFTIMWENAPFICALIGMSILSAWISVRLTRFYGRFEKNERILFETVTRLDRVESRLDRVESRLDRIETKLDMLISYILKGKTKETDN